MYKTEQITEFINELAPFELAEDWDNVGPLVQCKPAVTGVLLALDITDEVVQESIDKKCNVIVSHHPVIFKPMAQINSSDIVFKLITHNITAICAHTNLDIVEGGVNDVLADIFELQQTEVFDLCGRAGFLKKETTLKELALQCRDKLNAHVQAVDSKKPIKRVAVFGGAASGLVEPAIRDKVDCVITGEVKHHEALDALHMGVSMLSVGHYASEFPMMRVLAEKLKETFEQLPVHLTTVGQEPFSYYGKI